jgi:hypothetical protein
MPRARVWMSIAVAIALFGLGGCSDAVESEPAQTARGVQPPKEHEGLSYYCPPSEVVDLQTAIDSVEFPIVLPSHQFASPANVQEVCLDPSGRVVFKFPLPRPADQPLRSEDLFISEGWWYGGDPQTDYERRIGAYPEHVGKALYWIKGTPSLGDPAHNDETGLDGAFFTIVLGRGLVLELGGEGNGVHIELSGGESVDDLIDIVKTMQLEPITD